MNIKRFFANNSRDALALVKKALGPDAVILANRSVNGGNEIMALASDDMDELASSSAMSVDDVYVPSTVIRQEKAPKPASRKAELKKETRQDAMMLHRHQANAYSEDDESLDAPMLNFTEAQTESLLSYIHKNSEHVSVPAKAKKSVVNTKTNTQSNLSSSPYEEEKVAKMMHKPQFEIASDEMGKLMSEMRTMRGAIESQLAELVWENTQRREPCTSAMLRLLLASGFAPGLSRRIVEKMPSYQSEAEAQKWVENVLTKNIYEVESESEILDRGGVFAIIGPTGAGKTTTIAKLAARYVMKHGTNKLALITTDAYRIGGYEQLRIYGKILGVMVHSVKDEADLKLALNELSGKHTILIDTVGVNQRDSMVATQLAMLSGSNIQRLLCLNATCSGETLTDVVSTYKGRGLAGCIITKLDEAATIGSTLDVMIREKLKLYYITNGQRVPEDIHLANKKMLVQHAFKLNKRIDGHFRFKDEELPLLMAHSEKMSHAKFDEELSFD